MRAWPAGMHYARTDFIADYAGLSHALGGASGSGRVKMQTDQRRHSR